MKDGVETEYKLLADSAAELGLVPESDPIRDMPRDPLPAIIQEDVYLDTVDFRLLRAGIALRCRTRPDSRQFGLKIEEKTAPSPSPLRLRRELKIQVPANGSDPTDLPDAVRERIGPVIGGRRVAPVARLRTTRSRWILRPDPGGGIELDLDAVRVEAPDDPAGPTEFYEVELEDRGAGAKTVRSLGDALRRAAGLRPSDLNKLQRALAATGKLDHALRRDRVFDVKIRADDRFVDAAYRVFRRWFEQVLADEPGARLGEDSAFLHDMRVATRRLRAGFRTFGSAFPAGRLNRFNRDVKWLAALLGEVRDLDVYLDRLPEYLEFVHQDAHGPLEPLIDHVLARRAHARTRLLRGLDSVRYARLTTDFEAFLDRGPPADPSAQDAGQRVGEVAPQRVRKAMKRVVKTGRAIPRDPPAESLHRLRIHCKRLRYTCEFFTDIGRKRLKRLVRDVVELQELLGAHQDACVAGEALRSFANDLPAGRRNALATAVSIGQLVAAQERTAEQLRHRFRKAWKVFEKGSPHTALWK